MREPFEQMLTGGHPNSLGRTVEVVELIEKDESLLEELFLCYQSKDEVVRLRTSNAFKRVAKAHREWVVPYLDRFLHEISELDQASAQWTLAQLFLLMTKNMSEAQLARAKEILKRNLANHTDWIVLAQTMDTLGKWSKKDPSLKEWLYPHLDRLSQDARKSVANKAQKVSASL
ncbi:MAG: hypothetical protein AAF388_09585 [Bacteroidota bacterium]